MHYISYTVFDVEPQKLTGIVKYVGRIDSEYMDNKIYVGVKLDDAGTIHVLRVKSMFILCRFYSWQYRWNIQRSKVFHMPSTAW